MKSNLIIVDGVNGTGRQEFAQRLHYSIGKERSCWIPEEANDNSMCSINDTYFQNVQLLRVEDSIFALRGHPIEIMLIENGIELRSEHFAEYLYRIYERI